MVSRNMKYQLYQPSDIVGSVWMISSLIIVKDNKKTFSLISNEPESQCICQWQSYKLNKI